MICASYLQICLAIRTNYFTALFNRRTFKGNVLLSAVPLVGSILGQAVYLGKWLEVYLQMNVHLGFLIPVRAKNS